MLKKRLIFTLLFDDGYFILSRNFTLQRVGTIEWLRKNYLFSRISLVIDELFVLDVSRGEKNKKKFCDCLSTLAEECFVPIGAGGGIRNSEDAKDLFAAGADKIVLNTLLFSNPASVKSLVALYGRQAIVASLDVKLNNNYYEVRAHHGTEKQEMSLSEAVNFVIELGAREILLYSMDRDGTGQGLDMRMLDSLPERTSVPLIITGGVGKASHLAVGFQDKRIDAVATANLLNFIGDGLSLARKNLLDLGIELPVWDQETTRALRSICCI